MTFMVPWPYMPTAFSRSTDAFRDPSVDGGEQILYRVQEAAAQRFLVGAVEGVLATVDRKPP